MALCSSLWILHAGFSSRILLHVKEIVLTYRPLESNEPWSNALDYTEESIILIPLMSWEWCWSTFYYMEQTAAEIFPLSVWLSYSNSFPFASRTLVSFLEIFLGVALCKPRNCNNGLGVSFSKPVYLINTVDCSKWPYESLLDESHNYSWQLTKNISFSILNLSEVGIARFFFRYRANLFRLS